MFTSGSPLQNGEVMTPERKTRAEGRIDAPISIDELARRLHSGELSVRDAMRQWGDRTVWMALLHNDVRDELNDLHTRNHPARIFISYRWESKENSDWVSALADFLKGSGYDILLDRWNLVEKTADVPKFVARLASSDLCLMVITRGYLASVTGEEKPGGGIHDGWVFDEYQLTERTQELGRIEIVGLVRDKNVAVPSICARSIDARGTEDNFAAIAEAIGYSTIALNKTARQLLSDAIACSYQDPPLEALPRALRMLRGNELDATAEFAVLSARYQVLSGDNSAAIEFCRDALARSRDIQTVLGVSDILHQAGDSAGAIRLVLPFLKHGIAIAKSHFLVGNFLDDLGSLCASINHFRYATVVNSGDPDCWVNAGYVAFRGGNAAEAESSFRKALRLDPSHRGARENLLLLMLALGRPEARPLLDEATDQREAIEAALNERRGWLERRLLQNTDDIRCPECTATLPNAPNLMVCGDCGTTYSPQPGEPLRGCPCCQNSGRVPIFLLSAGLEVAVECPICHKGELMLAR